MFKLRFYTLAAILLATLSIAAKDKQFIPIAKVDTIHTASIVLDKAPVVVFGDTIFNIYGNLGSFTAAKRAKEIEQKIFILSSNYLFEADSIKFVDIMGHLNIKYQDEILMSLDSLQAAQEGRTKIEAAQYYSEQIAGTIIFQIENTTWKQILIQIAGCIGIIISEFFLIKLVLYLSRRLKILIRLQRGKKIKGAFNVIDDQRATLIIIGLVKFLRISIVIILLYIGLLAIFTLFPYTKHISDELLNYVITPLKAIGRSVVNYMPKLFTIIVIILIFRYIQKFFRSVTDKVAEGKIIVKGFYPDWAHPTYNIVSGLLFIFMFILIFPYLPNSDSQIFQGVSVFAGIMLSLGSTSVIGNLVSGLVITYMRPFHKGDRIKIGDFVGDVVEKSALVTRIKTPNNEIVTIPNSNVMAAQTVNYTHSAKVHGLIINTTFGVSYSIPWQKVHEMLHEVAERTENISKRQKPFIIQESFDDNYANYQLNVYIKDAKMTRKILSDLRLHAQDVFTENNIEMLAPQYIVNRSEEANASAVLPKYKDDEHRVD